MEHNEARYIQVVKERIVEEDLFDFPAFVVTIKEGGKPYGQVSKDMRARYPLVQFPTPGWGLSSPAIELPDGKKVIFTCLWKDSEEGEGYPDRIIVGCTASAIRAAVDAKCELLAMPLIGGGKKKARMPAMGKGLAQAVELQERIHGEEVVDVCVAVQKR